MSRVFVYLGRFTVIILGYAVAALAASAFIHILFLGSQGWKPDQVPVVVMGSLVFSVPLVALFVAYFAFIPSVPAILLAELLGRRDWLFYALAGAVIAAAVVAIFWMVPEPISADFGLVAEPAVRDPRFVGLVMAAGIVGGIAYWLAAGRLAGNWKTKARPPRPAGSPNS